METGNWKMENRKIGLRLGAISVASVLCHSERSGESPQSLFLRSRGRTSEILRSAQDDCELVRDGSARAQQSTIINRPSSIDHHQSTIINRPSSIDNHQSTIINQQSSINRLF
jgi:hypothetical protein